MFRITEDPSSGSLVQFLAKITKMVLSCPSVLWQYMLQPSTVQGSLMMDPL